MSEHKLPRGANTSDAAGAGAAAKAHPAALDDPSPPLPPEARDVIGEKLRGLYDSLVAEPLPDRFTRLLDELAAKEGQLPPPRKPEDKS